MIYVLVRKANEDYTSLMEEDEVTFVFDSGDFQQEAIANYQRRIEEVLANADVHAGIMFNGPAWIVALAGYMWYSRADRLHHNVYHFCKHLNKYLIIEGCIDEY